MCAIKGVISGFNSQILFSKTRLFANITKVLPRYQLKIDIMCLQWLDTIKKSKDAFE